MAQPINKPQDHGDHRLKCGQCRWFIQGFQGRTCQQTRLVTLDTKACIEFQLYKPTPFEQIEKDKFIVEMRKSVMIWTDETIKKYEKEIKSFKLLGSEIELKDPMSYVEEGRLAALGQKFQTCQAYIDRLLDLRFEIMDKCVELDSFAKDVQAYLFSNYRDHVQALKNEAERSAFFRAAAPELFKALSKMDSLKEKTEMAYENLKNTHFALARKQDAILELYKSKINSVEARNRSSG